MALTADELDLCRRMGLTPDAFAATKAQLHPPVKAASKWKPGDPPSDPPTEEQMEYFVQAAVEAAQPAPVAAAEPVAAMQQELGRQPNGDMIVALHPLGLTPLFDD